MLIDVIKKVFKKKEKLPNDKKPPDPLNQDRVEEKVSEAVYQILKSRSFKTFSDNFPEDFSSDVVLDVREVSQLILDKIKADAKTCLSTSEFKEENTFLINFVHYLKQNLGAIEEKFKSINKGASSIEDSHDFHKLGEQVLDLVGWLVIYECSQFVKYNSSEENTFLVLYVEQKRFSPFVIEILSSLKHLLPLRMNNAYKDLRFTIGKGSIFPFDLKRHEADEVGDNKALALKIAADMAGVLYNRKFDVEELDLKREDLDDILYANLRERKNYYIWSTDEEMESTVKDISQTMFSNLHGYSVKNQYQRILCSKERALEIVLVRLSEAVYKKFHLPEDHNQKSDDKKE